MRISWIKSKNDKDSFRVPKNMGFSVFEMEDLEDTDSKIEELVNTEKCNTIILSNEAASFSEDIIKKYAKNEEVSIIIAPRKKEY